MDLIDIIKKQTEEINKIYIIIDDLLDNENDKIEDYLKKLIDINNQNVSIINQRLDDMDLAILDEKRLLLKSKKELTKNVNNQMDKLSVYSKNHEKEITKKLAMIKGTLSERVDLERVDIKKVKNDSDMKNKKLINRISALEDELIKRENEFDKYKKEMEEIHTSLRREMRLNRQLIKK
jgi:hypothetical protein